MRPTARILAVWLSLAFAALGNSGCVLLAKKQLEGKLPKIDAAFVSVDVNTIYGMSGTLVETGVRWDGDTKILESSELRITSPAGSYHRIIRGAVAKP